MIFLCWCNITYSNRPDRVAQLAEHWASIPKVVGSNPTVVRHIFQACPVWIYTQSNITSNNQISHVHFQHYSIKMHASAAHDMFSFTGGNCLLLHVLKSKVKTLRFCFLKTQCFIYFSKLLISQAGYSLYSTSQASIKIRNLAEKSVKK